MSEKREPVTWITRGGKHIPIYADQASEDEQKKEREIATTAKEGEYKNNPLKEHFEKENKKVQELMDKRSGSIEMENGQILEKYTMKEMIQMILKDAKEQGVQYEDSFISIQYTDGSTAFYGEGDDTSKMKLANINGVIWDNPMTTAYSGKGVEIVNYKELDPKNYPDEKGYEDDWRMDFEHYRR